jgi:hypothetical protein
MGTVCGAAVERYVAGGPERGLASYEAHGHHQTHSRGVTLGTAATAVGGYGTQTVAECKSQWVSLSYKHGASGGALRSAQEALIRMEHRGRPRPEKQGTGSKEKRV